MKYFLCEDPCVYTTCLALGVIIWNVKNSLEKYCIWIIIMHRMSNIKSAGHLWRIRMTHLTPNILHYVQQLLSHPALKTSCDNLCNSDFGAAFRNFRLNIFGPSATGSAQLPLEYRIIVAFVLNWVWKDVKEGSMLRFNPLKTNCVRFYIRIQRVLRSKHSPPRL
jgi:hypothetical protein